MSNQQTVQQRRALKSFHTPETVLRRTIYQKARYDMSQKYIFLRMLAIFAMLAGWITLSYATQFRAHMTQWMLTGNFPIDDLASTLLYVVGFVATFGAFFLGMRWLDQRCEAKISAYYVWLVDQYNAEHETTLTHEEP
jgi:hypothetical protein